MRIADHAPALQSSQALQQPASTTHQQQILSGEVASAALNKQVDKKNREVNDAKKAEHETIRGESQGRNRNRGGESRAKDEGEMTQETSDARPPVEPGNGSLLDVTV